MFLRGRTDSETIGSNVVLTAYILFTITFHPLALTRYHSEESFIITNVIIYLSTEPCGFGFVKAVPYG